MGKLQADYTRYLRGGRGLAPGIGGSVAASLVPALLAPRYGNRGSPGFAVFFAVRPSAHQM